MRDRAEGLFDQEAFAKPQGPVECLGMTFENDEARREHFPWMPASRLNCIGLSGLSGSEPAVRIGQPAAMNTTRKQTLTHSSFRESETLAGGARRTRAGGARCI